MANLCAERPALSCEATAGMGGLVQKFQCNVQVPTLALTQLGIAFLSENIVIDGSLGRNLGPIRTSLLVVSVRPESCRQTSGSCVIISLEQPAKGA